MASTAEESDLVEGRRFRLYKLVPPVAPATVKTRLFLCVATTISLQRTAEFDDATAPKCSVPDAIPDRKSSPKSKGWNLNLSGKADDARIKVIEDDYESNKPAEYLLATMVDAAIGNGTEHSGFAFVENITREKSDNGFVSFSAQLRGNGKLNRADGTGVVAA